MLGCGDTPCAPCALRKAQAASLSGLEAPFSLPGALGVAAVTFGALWLIAGGGMASNRKRRYKEVTWPKSIYWDFPDSPEVEKPKPKKWWKLCRITVSQAPSPAPQPSATRWRRSSSPRW